MSASTAWAAGWVSILIMLFCPCECPACRLLLTEMREERICDNENCGSDGWWPCLMPSGCLVSDESVSESEEKCKSAGEGDHAQTGQTGGLVHESVPWRNQRKQRRFSASVRLAP